MRLRNVGRTQGHVKITLCSTSVAESNQGGEPLLEGVDTAQFAEHGVVELATYVGPEAVAEAYGGVVLFDGLLDN